MKELRYILAVLFSSLIIISGVGISVVQYCCAVCETTQSCCTSGCSKCHHAHRGSQKTCKDTGCTAVYYKVDFVKLDKWLSKLRIQRMAQLQGSVLILFFDFEQDEIPYVRHVERGANKLTLLSLYYNEQDRQDIHFNETQAGFVHVTGGTMRKNLRRSMRYLEYAPIETISNFCNNFFKSLSEIEE